MYKGLRGKLIIMSISLMIILSGCSNMAVLMAGHGNGQEMEYSYHYFNGTKSEKFHMEKGTKIKLTYQVEIEKGEVDITVFNKEGVIPFEKSFTENNEGEEVITIDEEGRYYIQVEGKKTKGSFLVQYEEL